MLTVLFHASTPVFERPSRPGLSARPLRFQRGIVCAAIAFALLAAAAFAQLPQRGRMLPDVPIQMGSKPLDLKQYRGKALVIGLISTTCAHCAEAMQALKQVQTKLGPAGLQVVAAAGDPAAGVAVGPYAAKMKANFPIGSLDQAAFIKLAGIKPNDRPFVPIIMFVDRKGLVRVQYFGDDGVMKQNAAATILVTAEHLLKDPAPPKKAAPKE